jgi:hypothetical protein
MNKYSSCYGATLDFRTVLVEIGGSALAGTAGRALCLDWWVKLKKAITVFASVVYI